MNIIIFPTPDTSAYKFIVHRTNSFNNFDLNSYIKQRKCAAPESEDNRSYIFPTRSVSVFKARPQRHHRLTDKSISAQLSFHREGKREKNRISALEMVARVTMIAKRNIWLVFLVLRMSSHSSGSLFVLWMFGMFNSFMAFAHWNFGMWGTVLESLELNLLR